MKRLYFTVLSLACCLMAGAQNKVYVCDGYDQEGVQVEAGTAFKYSSDGTQVTIGQETFDIADIDSITFSEPQFEAVKVTWTESGAKVDIPSTITGVTATVNGGHVKVTSTNTTKELLYVLEGTSSKGSFNLYGTYKLRIHLNGVSLTNPDSAAMNIQCGKRVEVKLMKGTVNTFADGTNGKQKAAFYTKGHLEIKGKGTLNVTGNTKHALCAKEYLQFKASTGEVNILGAVNDGIHCGEGDKADYENLRFIMNGGTVNISGCQKDCIDSDDYGSAYINGGTINLNITQKDGSGVVVDSLFYMNGGEININNSGTICQGIKFCYNGYFNGGTIKGTMSGEGTKGIKAKKVTAITGTVKNGGNAFFNGTNVEFVLNSGTYTVDSTKCGGLRIDNNLTQTDGDIHITVKNSDAVAIEVKGTDTKTGGTRTID